MSDLWNWASDLICVALFSGSVLDFLVSGRFQPFPQPSDGTNNLHLLWPLQIFLTGVFLFQGSLFLVHSLVYFLISLVSLIICF